MGLLDQVFGAPGSDQSQAIGLLSAGLMRGDFGGGLLAANQIYSPENKLKRDYMQAQMANLQSEVESRKAALEKQAQMQKLLSDAFGPGQQPPAQMGQLGSGSFGVVPPVGGQPAIPQMQPAPAGSRLAGMSPDTLALLKANGLDLVDVAKLARPDMQVSNGYAYDKNNVRAGFLPQLNVAQNGQASMVTIGPDGQPQMAAPRGAVETYSQFRNADEAAKAQMDVQQVFNPNTKQPEFRTRQQVVDAAQAPQAGVNGNFTGDPAKIVAAISSLKDPQERANAMAAFAEQANRTKGFAQGAPFAAGPSMSDTNTAAADKTYQENVAKDVVEQRKAIMNADMTAPTNIAKYQQIGKLLANVDGGRWTPAGYEMASALNSLGIKVSKDLGNVQAAQAMANEAALQLRNPNGGAGMPGAMSDQDRNFLASMTPNLAQSADGRKQVIDAYIATQRRSQQVAQFARKYEDKYGKLDNGFFQQLSAWSSANPLFGGK